MRSLRVTIMMGSSFIRYIEGVKTGPHWVQLPGDAFLVGDLDEVGKMHGEEVTYLYPDLVTALAGTFTHGNMGAGRLVQLTGLR